MIRRQAEKWKCASCNCMSQLAICDECCRDLDDGLRRHYMTMCAGIAHYTLWALENAIRQDAFLSKAADISEADCLETYLRAWKNV